MNNAYTTCLVALCATAATCAVQAQNFGGVATFTLGPLSQVGAPTNALVIFSTANGFVATNTVTVATVPAPVAGTLVFWQLDRPFTLSTATTFFTTTDLDGFVVPPGGVFSPTSGSMRTYVIDTANNNNIFAGTTSQLGLSLVNGGTSWSNLTNNSPNFTLPAYNFYAVRQVFDLDGVYVAGGGGSWIVDVPAASSITPIPELPTAALLALGVLALALRRATGANTRR